MYARGRGRGWCGCLLVVGCTACSNGSASSTGSVSVDSAGPVPSPSIGVEPRDLTTDYAGKKVDVTVSLPFGGAPDRAWLDTGLTLTDVVGAPVSTSAAFVDSADGPFTYELTMTGPVAAGWYTFTIDPPSGAQIGYGASEQPAPLLARSDGRYESRFRIGSSPLLLSVAMCASNDPAFLPKLIVWFSEPVTLPASSPFDVRANGAPVACTLSPGPTPQEPMAELTCTPPVPADADVQVTIGAGLTSADGSVPLASATGAIPLTLVVPAAEPNVPCRTFREPRLPP